MRGTDQTHRASLGATAQQEGLEIEATVADIRRYEPARSYDVVVIDRTLHMLAAEDRGRVLRSLLHHTNPGASVLIADERSNIPAFQKVFDASAETWKPILKRRGFLFVRRRA